MLIRSGQKCVLIEIEEIETEKETNKNLLP